MALAVVVGGEDVVCPEIVTNKGGSAHSITSCTCAYSLVAGGCYCLRYTTTLSRRDSHSSHLFMQPPSNQL